MPHPWPTQPELQRLTHRTHDTETFVVDATSVRTTPGESTALSLTVAIPAEHPYYGSRSGSAGTDDFFLQEVLRQAGSVFAHLGLGVPLGTALLVQNWRYEVLGDGPSAIDNGAAVPASVTVRAIRQRTGRGGHLASATLDAQVRTADGIVLARLICDAAYLPGERYAALRRARTGAGTGFVPTTAGLVWPGATPAAPEVVGVAHERDVVLSDLDVTAGTALLTPRTDHRTYFDHALDHIPTMVVHEAAVQFAVALGLLRSGQRHHVHAEYPAFLELAAPARLVVSATDGSDVVLEARQGDVTCARVNLRPAAASGLTGRRPVREFAS